MMAIRRPRRAASACAHVRNAAPAGLRPRQMPQLACTSSARNSPGPTFVMAPRWRRSAELSSDGTKPRNALARAASPPKRAGVSSTAAKVSATIGPTPGAVIKCCAIGIPRGVSYSQAASAVLIVAVSCWITARNGVMTVASHRRQRHLVEPRQDALGRSPRQAQTVSPHQRPQQIDRRRAHAARNGCGRVSAAALCG